MSLLVYIPARGGSKRIPGKNIKCLGGIPVLARVIKAIQRACITHHIAVSTDDVKTAEIAKKAGASVLGLRDRKLSNDRATFMDLLKNDVPRHLSFFNLNEQKADILFVLATAALVTPEVYRSAFFTYKNKRANILVATNSYAQHPFRALIKTKNRWRPLSANKLMKPSQKLPLAQVDAGLFYFLKYQSMSRVKKHWFSVGKGLVCYPVPESMAVDVDTAHDWKNLEDKYRTYYAPHD